MIDDAFGVAHDAIVMLGAHGFEQFKTSDPRSTRPIEDDTHILDFLARQMQRIDKASCADHGRSMLVVMENGDVHHLFQTLLDDETLWRLDVFKVDPAKGRPHQADSIDESVGIFGIKLDVDAVHIGKPLEQNRLAFHHRLGRQCPKIAKTQNCRPVRDYSHKVALVRIIISRFGRGGDFLAWHSNARGIGQRQIALRRHGNGGRHLELAWCRFHMKGQGLFAGQSGLCHFRPVLLGGSSVISCPSLRLNAFAFSTFVVGAGFVRSARQTRELP